MNHIFQYSLIILLLSFGLSETFAQHSIQKQLPSKTNSNYGKYNFSFKTLDGKTIKVGDFGGKILLVNIWAPWCEPCKKESEGLAKLYKEFHPKGFEVVGIAVKTTETAVRSFIQENNVTWQIGIKDDLLNIYKTVGLPQSYLFNRDGSLIKEFVGYTAEEALRQQLEQILKPKK
ncbi:MAG: TlpA family protein disulfide reductase [Ignavibacteriales bacterium]|nr:TlpA family protein disulfide reductase [Ignavibacteriales bacterium]